MRTNTANVQKNSCTVKNILYAYQNLETTATDVIHMQSVLLTLITSLTVDAKMTYGAMVSTNAHQESGYHEILISLYIRQLFFILSADRLLIFSKANVQCDVMRSITGRNKEN